MEIVQGDLLYEKSFLAYLRVELMRHRHAPIFLAVLISDKSDMAFFIRLLAALCWMVVVGVASTSIPLPYIIMAWYPKVMFVASLNSLHSLFIYLLWATQIKKGFLRSTSGKQFINWVLPKLHEICHDIYLTCLIGRYSIIGTSEIQEQKSKLIVARVEATIKRANN